MYCEKCGKMNADGAIFCSNCSTILRSRRQSSVSAPEVDATKRFSPVEQKQVNEVAKEAPVAVQEKPAPFVPLTEEVSEPSAPQKQERKKESKKLREYEDVVFEEEKSSGSAWYGILAAVSWLVFVAFAAVGIIGGGWMLLYGFSEGTAIFTFGGGAVLIVCFVIGLYILSKNMVQIKIAKLLGELKK